MDNFGIVVIDLSLQPTQILEKIVDKSKQVSFAVYAIMQAFVVQQRYLYQSLYFNRFLALRFIVRRPLVSSLCDVRCSSAVKNYLLNYNTNYFASFFFRYYANNPTQTKQQQQSKKPASSARSATRRKKSPTKEKKKIKIILIESVPNLGEKGEHVRVAKGFARNYLIPKRLAVYATPENIKLYEEWTKNIDYAAKERAKMLEKAKKKISKIVVEVKRHEVSPGVLHSNVTPKVIAEKLYKQHRIELDPSNIKLSAPLSKFGRHEVVVDLGGVEGILNVNVVKR